MSDITFQKSLYSYKAVYFHFLDGFINPKVGDSIDNVLKFVINHKLVSNNINLLVTDINKLNVNLQFYNLANNSTEIVHVSFQNLNTLDESTIKKLRKCFNYCIFQVGLDDHATSFLIFEKENKLFLQIINSGSGINFNAGEQLNGKDVYTPYVGINICNNTGDISELSLGIKKILTILQVPYLYELITHTTKLTSVRVEPMFNKDGVQIGNEQVTYVNFYPINIILQNLKTFFPLINFSNFDINISLTTTYTENFNFNLLYTRNNNADIRLGFANGLNITVPNKYYLMVVKILQSSRLPEFKLSQLNINNLDNYNNISLDAYRRNKSLSDTVINKLILHNIDNKLYINPQESGSCAWFSIYWPICLYDVFINNDSVKYCEQIKKINTECEDVVNAIFVRGNFMNEYLTESNSNFEYMKILCNKFIDIKILSNDILINEVDFIFNNSFNSNITEIGIFDTGISQRIGYRNLIDKLLAKPIDSEFPLNLLKALINGFADSEIKSKSKLVTSCYKLFLFVETNHMNLFSQTKITSCKTIKDDLIALINQQHFDPDVIKPNLLGITPYYDSKNKIVMSISGFDISLLLNYESLFNQTYDYDINQNNTPAYFNDYIHIAMFLNESDLDINPTQQIKFGFDGENKVNLLKFILFMHRFNMFTRILAELNKIISQCNKFVYPGLDFGMIIGTEIFNSIIKNYVSYNDTIQFENSLIKENLTVLPIDYKYLINYIPESSDCLKLLEDYNGNISDYKTVRNFFYKYPKYLYQTFTGTVGMNEQTFIHLNIYDIFKPENSSHRDNLIYYFTNLWYETTYLSTLLNKQEMINIILYNLQLLLFKYGCEGMFLTYVNGIQNIFTKEQINKELLKIQKLIATNFNKDDIYNIKKNFCKHIVDNKDNLLNKNMLIKNLIKKYVPEVVFGLNNDILINGKEFVRIQLDNTLLKNLFSINDEYFHYYLIEKVAITDTITNYNDKKLYRISESMCLEIIANFTKSLTSKYSIAIKTISYNGNIVYKYSDIDLPFKFIIPTNCFHFIYKKNNIFNITYLRRELPEITDSLLGDNNLAIGSYTFTINPNTLFYFGSMEQNVFDNLVKICKNYQVNKYNILYIHDTTEPATNGYYYNDKCYELMEFNWKAIFNDKLGDFLYLNVNLLNKVKDEGLYSIEYVQKDLLDRSNPAIPANIIKSLEHLLDKISRYTINTKVKDKHIQEFRDIIRGFKKYSKDFTTNLVKNNSIGYLLTNYNYLYEYLALVKVHNFINRLFDLNDDQAKISLIKINNELFNVKKQSLMYKFEVLFELISGYELLDEQMDRYTQIVTNFIDYEKTYNRKKFPYHDYKQKTISQTLNLIDVNYLNNMEQSAGASYPLHHFMMGKGKSAMMTPLLTICFANYNKNVIIVVPDHLKRQTQKTMIDYINIFRLNKNVEIYSDSEMKEKFLNGEFSNPIRNSNKVMLIDEFDTVLDPIKSNFNITEKKNESVTILYQFMLPIVKLMKTSPQETIDNLIKAHLQSMTTTQTRIPYTAEQIKYLSDDITNIYDQVKDNFLKENINWGIHPIKCFVIPYMNKDKPLLKSNFSSSIITVFLTLYYYIVIMEYKVNVHLTTFLIKNKMIKKLFKANIHTHMITTDYLNDIIGKLDMVGKIELFDKIFIEIFNGLSLATEQYNTSFVDIVNIDNMFKVGYSGTVNVILPSVKSEIKFDVINPDEDEDTNVKYAIIQSNIIKIQDLTHTGNKDLLFGLIFANGILNNYDALIDTIGLFKNIKNQEIAEYLFNRLDTVGTKKRDIIFLDELDNKLSITKNTFDSDFTISDYNEHIKYFKPFIYYSQSHIVGIDIKQDNYPVMKGLCIIDAKSVYTDVAQSIFRLRKINLGHTIDFLFLDSATKTSKEIYSMLKSNDKSSMDSKENFLTYQTIKSEIRKNRPVGPIFKTGYKEKIHYYYLEQIPDYRDTNLFLSGIITKGEITSNKLEPLFDKINNKETLLSLVYGINSNIIQHQQEMDLEEEDEKEKEKKKEIKIEKSSLIYIPDKPMYSILSWNFNNYDPITSLDLFYKTFVIEVNDLIGFLPNMFSNSNYYKYYKNTSGVAFAYIKKGDADKIIIIPGYVVPYLIDKFPILDINLKVLNKDFIPNITPELLLKLNAEPIIKIINNSNDSLNIESLDPITILIGSHIISDYEYINSNQSKWREITYRKEADAVNIIRSKISIPSARYKIKWINYEAFKSTLKISDTKILDLFNKPVTDKQGGSDFKDKYIKYKNKYLTLKNQLGM